MIDFDDMDEKEGPPAPSAEPTADRDGGWERRALNRVMMAPSVSVDHSSREDEPDNRLRPLPRRREKIEVLLRQALEGKEVKVVLPKRAKFKHIKLALAKKMDSDEVLRSGHLMRKSIAGAYVPYKDESAIGDVREVLVLRTDLSSLEAEEGGLCISVSDDELSPAEAEPAPARASASSSGASASRRSAPTANGALGVAGAPGAKVGGGLPARPTINRKTAIRLQMELHEGFSQPEFRLQLAELMRHHESGALTETEFTKRRKELLLTVQREILPRYGFEGSLVGVFKMMAALGSYVKDPEFMQWATRINDMLGINSPPESWGSLSKECKKLRMKDSRPYDEVLAAKTTAARLRDAVAATLPKDPWPEPEKAPAFKLSIVGSWNDFKPMEMEWRGGLFVFLVSIGQEGTENFQILLNGSWDKTIYPSVPDATPFDAHKVLGPDKGGHGKNWQIGKGFPEPEDRAAPGVEFAVIAVINKGGRVKVVTWQELA